MSAIPEIRQDAVRIQKLILPQQTDEVIDFLHSDFLYTEPLNAAMQITADECRELDGGETKVCDRGQKSTILLSEQLVQDKGISLSTIFAHLAAVRASNSDVSFAARTTDGEIAGVRLACIIRREEGHNVDIYAGSEAKSNNYGSSKVAEIRRMLEEMESKVG